MEVRNTECWPVRDLRYLSQQEAGWSPIVIFPLNQLLMSGTSFEWCCIHMCFVGIKCCFNLFPVEISIFICIYKLHPWRITWNIIMEVWKIIFLSKWVICRFHVDLPGCRFLVENFWGSASQPKKNTAQPEEYISTRWYRAPELLGKKRCEVSGH